MDSSGKFVPRVFASYKSASPIYFLEVLSCCQIVTKNKIELKKLNHNHCKLLPTAPCNIVGQGRAVVVVINAPYHSLSQKNRLKESELQPPTTETAVVYKHTLKGYISNHHVSYSSVA
jgi:hypothetical protein